MCRTTTQLFVSHIAVSFQLIVRGIANWVTGCSGKVREVQHCRCCNTDTNITTDWWMFFRCRFCFPLCCSYIFLFFFFFFFFLSVKFGYCVHNISGAPVSVIRTCTVNVTILGVKSFEPEVSVSWHSKWSIASVAGYWCLKYQLATIVDLRFLKKGFCYSISIILGKCLLVLNYRNVKDFCVVWDLDLEAWGFYLCGMISARL